MSSPWTDWLTESFFRIRISAAAADKLSKLPAETQLQLRQMLQDIAELTDAVPLSTSREWKSSDPTQLLQLHLGRVSVRYFVDERSRTLSIEHVVVPADSADDLEKIA